MSRFRPTVKYRERTGRAVDMGVGLQHDANEVAHCAGSLATADTCKLKVKITNDAVCWWFGR